MNSLVSASEALLAERPDAVFCLAPTRVTTRRELAARARELEMRIAAATAPGEVVALALRNGPDLPAAFLATLRTGRVALLLDAALPAGTRATVAQRLHARVLLGSGPDGEPGLEALPHTGTPPLPPGTAVLKLSSGSTRSPRGIAVTQAALLSDARALARVMRIGAGDRALAIVPMSFSYGLSSLLVPALTDGLVLVLPAEEGPFAALRAAHEHAVTFFPAVPALLGGLQRQGTLTLPASLRLVISAGAAISPAAASSFRARFGHAVHAFYGASECGGIAYDTTGEAAERGTVGRPVPGVDLRLEGPDATVRVSSPAVAISYWPTPDPALRDGTFVTSDCARFDLGELRLLGRHCESINVDGRKVHPHEVESVLGTMPGVDDVVVVRDTNTTREGESCWALIASETGTISRAQVLDWCRRQLPTWMVPRRVTVLPRLPRNARGKLDRETLARLCGGAEI